LLPGASPQIVHELVQVLVGAAAGRDRGACGLAPPTCGLAAGGSRPAVLVFHDGAHALLDLAAREHPRGRVAARAHAGAPRLLDEPGVDRLVGPQRQRRHRHPEAERLQRGVPAAVRDEAAHGAVRQDVQLRAPAHDERVARRRRRVQQVARELRLLAGPDDPQERLASRQEAAGQLLHLGGADGRVAAEGDVDDGARRPGVQPLDAGVLRVEQVGAVGEAVDVPGIIGGRQRNARPYGSDLEVALQPIQNLILQLIERVDENPVPHVSISELGERGGGERRVRRVMEHEGRELPPLQPRQPGKRLAPDPRVVSRRRRVQQPGVDVVVHGARRARLGGEGYGRQTQPPRCARHPMHERVVHHMREVAFLDERGQGRRPTGLQPLHILADGRPPSSWPSEMDSTRTGPASNRTVLAMKRVTTRAAGTPLDASLLANCSMGFMWLWHG
uniref:Uncharacterized protein n=1 Tax=Triticum urartu TaxID=4572 RepID=A0A8R7PBH9_TRIUA